jgi:hypothetical protein
VRSLVDEGILGYWERVLLKRTSGGAGAVGVVKTISHLTSIDEELSSRMSLDIPSNLVK